ncbi:MAG: hypothetical protein RIQ41_267 [Candidatus Parcubacteria bacterium]|jgi:hypothetical protein
MQHRRLLFLFGAIALFSIGVIVWYFMFSTPRTSPSIESTASPLSTNNTPSRFAFIFQGEEPSQTTQTEVTQAPDKPLVLVWDKPTTGNVFVTKSILREVATSTLVGTTTVTTTKSVRATSTVLMFVDRITGYVYGYTPSSGTTYQISNTTIPGVYDAFIWSNGERIVLRYLGEDKETIISIAASIPNVQEGRDAQPLTNVTTLPQNISSVAVSQSSTLLSYLVPNQSGASIYTLTQKGLSKLADSPFSEWSLSYGGETLYATTKASAYVEGTTVVLPSFSPVVSNKTGLITTPSSSGTSLSSMWSRSGLALFASQAGKVTQIASKTIASKCVAAISSSFVCGIPKTIPRDEEGLPDDWYQGKISFNDTLSFVSGTTGEVHTLYDGEAEYGPTDITHIATSKGNEFISFIRKQNGSLFLFNSQALTPEE